MTENIVVRGFVATYPTLKHLPNGTPVVNFRVASTPRWFDNATQSWREGSTNWYTVNAFRQLAHNSCRSLQIGHPVFISGKLKIKTWEREDGSQGSSVEIDAHTLGHDLALGTSGFQRNVYPQPPSDADNNQTQTNGQSVESKQTVSDQQKLSGDFYQDQAKMNPQTWGQTPEETQQILTAEHKTEEDLDFDDISFEKSEEKEAVLT